MRRLYIRMSMACAMAALLALGPAIAEDASAADEMPIVMDVPLTAEELEQIERAASEGQPTVPPEETNDLVREAQQVLINLGYLTGSADGMHGPRTTRAIEEFQSRYDLPVNGWLDEATMQALREMSATIADAKELQQRLIDLGYLRGMADGIFGERSHGALRLFQSMNGLEATGKSDEATCEKLFSEDALALPERLSRGDKGERVEALQNKLIQYGFLSGEVDGNYGPNTAGAVSRLQRHLQAQGMDESYGIFVTGEATSATLALFCDPDYTSYIKDIAGGDEDPEVQRIERRLAGLGYMDSTADETFDDYAVSAAHAFQQDAGLPQGTVDRATVDALFGEDVARAKSFVPHDIGYGDRGLAVRAVEEALVRVGLMIKMPNGRYDDALQEAVGRLHDYLESANSPDAPLLDDPAQLSQEAQKAIVGLQPEYTGDVNPDDESNEARRVQCRLHTLYYLDRLHIDGKFGENSVNALKAFQEKNSLPVTGVADHATQSLLFSDGALCDPRPYRVEVDIDHQNIYVYELQEDGAYEKTHTFICSTGLGNSTPRGIFLDGYPVNYWHHFSKYDCWAKYSFEIEGNIMFHSVIYSSNNEKTLRESSLYALGQKASHGCIRMRVADARWLYEHCKRGSLVIVIY